MKTQKNDLIRRKEGHFFEFSLKIQESSVNFAEITQKRPFFSQFPKKALFSFNFNSKLKKMASF